MFSEMNKKVFWEVIFIFTTVLIFRGIWTLMDKVDFLTSELFLYLSLVFGIIVSAIALYKIHCCKT